MTTFHSWQYDFLVHFLQLFDISLFRSDKCRRNEENKLQYHSAHSELYSAVTAMLMTHVDSIVLNI